MSDRLKVDVIEDGPIKVSNVTSLKFCGRFVKTKGDELFLCRCGASKNAPYCDGSHNDNAFSGENQLKAKETKVWEGKTIRTFFNPNACMHVFHCQPMKDLRARELAGDTEAGCEIANVISTCPSGALSYEAKEALEGLEDLQHAAAIEIMEGGEIRVQQAFDINIDLQERQPSDKATLCRCGMSKNKPWCDGRHKAKKGFK